MNATELQIRLKNFVYKVVDLRQSLYSRSISKFFGEELKPVLLFDFVNHRQFDNNLSDGTVEAHLNIAVDEIERTIACFLSDGTTQPCIFGKIDFAY